MGCVNSKKSVARVHSPPSSPKVAPRVGLHSRKCGNRPSRNDAVEQPRVAVGMAVPSSSSTKVHHPGAVVALETREDDPEPKEEKKRSPKKEIRSHNSSKGSSREEGSLNMSIGLPSSYRCAEAEQIAAGWPPWLTSVAGEAIQGWIPLKTKSFEKLDKIGQGTYSSVFQAREVETGRFVALKKVRFDNWQPESIRFMAREIIILRTLDHPNIMKLEGIITSQQSSSIYLVFEYMEHDLAGLVSSPEIKFSESQIKCYMRQLLSGLEHCHLRGIMHRDIKVSNILVNNEGILKIADFGLANTLSQNHKYPLTSRVVTLWYRPPELLMGSTNYGVSVDLWSIGCVFAELFLGKPILKGRNEVEQLHKIFKLCGSPPEEYWRKCKLPLATMFKPQTNYESSLVERCKGFPATAVNLIDTLLSIDPCKRGTASSALMSEYFNTKPFACNPSVLPKYPPSKEMDAKNLYDIRRKKAVVKAREAVTYKRPSKVPKVLQDPTNIIKPSSREEMHNTCQNACRGDDKTHHAKGKVGKEPLPRSEVAHVRNGSMDYNLYSGSSGFAWVNKRKQDATSTLSDGSRSKISGLDPNFAKDSYDLTKHGIDVSGRNFSHQDETSKHISAKDRGPGQRQSFDEADTYYSKQYLDFDLTEKPHVQGHRKHSSSLEQSIPTMIQGLDEVNNVRRAVRKSRFG